MSQYYQSINEKHAYHSIDAEAELTTMLQNAIQEEIKKEQKIKDQERKPILKVRDWYLIDRLIKKAKLNHKLSDSEFTEENEKELRTLALRRSKKELEITLKELDNCIKRKQNEKTL
jgi:hypothetical protein